jgi:carbamoyl-phosphate synthase large subunit
MVGKSLVELGFTETIIPPHFAVKEAVFPFARFPGVDTLLGPEMRSTGEVMGSGRSFGEAYGKAIEGSGTALPRAGKALLSVRDADKRRLIGVARSLVELGFELVATGGTHDAVQAAGIPCTPVHKVTEGRPHVVDMIRSDEISLIVNTTEGKQAILDSASIRRAALQHKVSYTTTIAGAEASCLALRHLGNISVRSLRELHAEAG